MVIRALLLCILFLLVAGSMAVPPAQAVQVRWDEVGPFFWGNLTWQNGQGRIVWGPAPPGIDDMPPMPSQDSTEIEKAKIERETGIETAPPPPGPDVFTSDPIPRNLFINGSGKIQLQLYLKEHPENDQPCGFVSGHTLFSDYDPVLEVDLRAGEDRLSGAGMGDYVNWPFVHPTRALEDPEGYGACHFSMHPEMSVLPEGTVLKLTVRHLAQLYHYPYGLQGDHRSTLRIPIYPPEEVPFRFADLLEEPEPTDPVTDAPMALGAIPAALSLLAWSWRRKSVPTVLALLLVLLALSGCLGNKAASDGHPSQGDDLQGRIDNRYVSDDDGDLTRAGTGSILGQVYDDLHIPVQGVHVSLLGLTQFTQTDAKGRFTFAHLSPGTYHVRFDKPDYRSFETQVEVKDRVVTRPGIMLFLLDPKERDFRPHVHDYWPAGQATQELPAFKIVPECDPGPPEICRLPFEFTIPPQDGEVRSVFPGTREVEVTLAWDQAKVGAERIALKFSDNSDPARADPYGWLTQNYSVLAPRAPSQPFRIQTTWEMEDPGHQQITGWKFRWEPAREGWYRLTDTRLSVERDAQIDVQITLRKGTVPLEPPHKEHWGSLDKLQIVKDQRPEYKSSTVPPGTPELFGSGSGQGGPYEYEYPYRPHDLIVQPVRVVPSGTAWVEVRLHQSREFTTDFDWILHYKPANLPVPTDFWGRPTGEGYREFGPPTTSEGQTRIWRVPVKPEEVDPEYAKATAWEFRMRASDEMAKWQDFTANAEASSAAPDPMVLTANAFVHRTPLS